MTGFSPLWDSTRSHVKAVLRDVQVEVQVGLHPWEQHPERPTRLLVNVEMYAHTEGKGVGGDPHGFIDYDPIRAALKTWPGRPHTPLLEDLVEELVALCFGIRAVEACRISVLKPDIFNEAAGAGIEVYRVRPAG
jgi:dihydroneopterin aldolase